MIKAWWVGLCRKGSGRPAQCTRDEAILRWLLAEKTWILEQVADIIIESEPHADES